MQINSVTLSGRLGRDPEVKYFESGTANAKFSIAVDRPQKDAPTDWFECVAWGKTSEIVANYCKKGSQIGVTGAISLETWTDGTTGNQRFKHIVNVQSVTLLGSKSDNTSGGNTSSAGASTYDEDF